MCCFSQAGDYSHYGLNEMVIHLLFLLICLCTPHVHTMIVIFIASLLLCLGNHYVKQNMHTNFGNEVTECGSILCFHFLM